LLSVDNGLIILSAKVFESRVQAALFFVYFGLALQKKGNLFKP
jgi:hypothetical protein